MPNWVRNIVTFNSDADRLNDIREALKNEDENTVFDFNKLVPMPDSLKIDEGTRSDRAEECHVAKIKNDETKIKELKEKYGDDFNELLKLGEICEENRKKYGYRSWYGWSIKNWGTKWNAREPMWIDDNVLVFETAWSCPRPIFNKLAEKFSDLEFDVRYADEDIGYNCGTLEYSKGTLYFNGIEPEPSYDFAFDVWDYDDASRKEFLEEIGE